MCTYKLTFNDSLVEGAKRSFPNQEAITSWMEQQVERMLRQISVKEEGSNKALRQISVSDRIKALSAVPASSADEDYKDEMITIMSEKYGSR